MYRHVKKYWHIKSHSVEWIPSVSLLWQVMSEHNIQLHDNSGNQRLVKAIFCCRMNLICTLLVPCRPASSECTGPLWITIRLLWRRRTSAARQTHSLQRYLRYVITLRTAGLQQASVWCCTAARDKWWQGSFISLHSAKSHAALYSSADCFNCAVGQLLGFNEGIFSHHSLSCYLPARISRSKAQRTAKTSRLKIHWKVSTEWNEWPASTLINIAISSWAVTRPVDLTLPPPQLFSTNLWTEWRAAHLFCM